jgi:hypothetical protein
MNGVSGKRSKLPEGKLLIPGIITNATLREIHPSVVSAKLAALAEGAQLATKELWDDA